MNENKILPIQPQTENLITDVYFDSTLSMKGFVETSSYSIYQQVVTTIERPFIQITKDAEKHNINFYKFGSFVKKEKLEDRAFRDADKPIFYTESELSLKTEIQKVVENADTNNLSLIITDLFQEKSDIDLLTKTLNEKFITKNLAFGIIGIKSQFKGTIYDVGPNKNQFIYESNELESSYRPFYILALGKHADIKRYFDSLLQLSISTFPKSDFLIVSPYITDKEVPFAKSKIVDIKGVNEVNGVLVENSEQRNNFKEFRVKNNSKEYYVKNELPFSQLSNIGNFGKIKSLIQSCNCDSNTNLNQNVNVENVSNQTVPNNLEQKNATLEVLSEFSNEKQESEAETKNNLSITVKLKLEEPKSQKIKCYRVILQADEKVFPNWINEWNMSIEQIENWKRLNSGFDGSKTYNLAPFLTTLISLNNQHIYEFYLYIN